MTKAEKRAHIEEAAAELASLQAIDFLQTIGGETLDVWLDYLRGWRPRKRTDDYEIGYLGCACLDAELWWHTYGKFQFTVDNGAN